MIVLHTTNAFAKVYMGKITLEVGDTYEVSAVPTSGYTASGSFSKSGTCFNITANGSYYCKIKANYVGKGTLSYWGSVAPSGSWSTYIYDYYWDIEVKGPQVCVTSITLNTSSASLKVGETKQLTATVSPSNATDKSVSWSSSNNSVATVSSSGLVTAKGTGSASITCRANDECGKQTTCNVTVSDPVTISINSTNFPDGNFRNYLLEQNYGKDGVLTGSEINDITNIYVDEKNIGSLKGIEFFTSLKYLHCYKNQLTALDVSKNTAILWLYCGSNKLTILDVSKNTALTILDCEYNQLTTLDVSKNTALHYLYCGSNKLTILDVSKNTALTRLHCSENQLNALDVSKNTELTDLLCNNNQLTILNVSNTELTRLDCSNNQLKALDVSKSTALTGVNCYQNNIKGKAMDALINSLPNNTSSEEHSFRTFSTYSSEGNVCTTAQVTAVKNKGWIPQYLDTSNFKWKTYEGSEDTSIATSISLPVSQTVEVGKTLQLTPTIVPAEAEAMLTWTTDDASIAKVTSTGLVFGSKEGTAIITVTTDNGLKAVCFVMVQLPSGISSVGADSEDAPVYTLSGQRLAAPRKGINIVGGKKVIIR